MISYNSAITSPLLDEIEQNIKNHPKLSCAYSNYSDSLSDDSLEGMLVECYMKLQKLFEQNR